MLAALTIRDIVLIDRLDLDFQAGLTVLTGETGAGKSIILDALGLALGARGDGALVRPGVKEGSVSAIFELNQATEISDLFEESGLAPADQLILRRVQGADGRTRAFVNDQTVSVQLLRQFGAALVEIHGQHDERALLDQTAHRDLLDAFGGLQDDAEQVKAAWGAWRSAENALSAHDAALEQSRIDEEYLRHSVEELEQLAPEVGEEDQLSAERQLMMHAEKFSTDLSEAHDALAGDAVADARLNAALRKLERNRDKAAGRFDQAIDALDRAIVELGEARATISQALADIEYDPQKLEQSEERLFALRAAARKYKVGVDDLPAVATEMADRLSAIARDEGTRFALEKNVTAMRTEYDRLAAALTEKRAAAAEVLDRGVQAELPPLKLEKALFQTEIAPAGEGGPSGCDLVEFKIATNPNQQPGPLMKIASGGELSRFVLALKVVLAQRSSSPVLVFDEIDSGAGGAVADAIGARLAVLAQSLQVLAVTHSPQVAAQAAAHWKINKRAAFEGDEERALTEIEPLDAPAREEEIARMLAGAKITPEARAAAARLIGGSDGA